MNVHALPRVAPQMNLAIRIDGDQRNAACMLRRSQIDLAAEFTLRSLHTRIERTAHLITLFNTARDRALNHPPAGADATRRKVWRAMVINSSQIECLAAIRRVMRGEV